MPKFYNADQVYGALNDSIIQLNDDFVYVGRVEGFNIYYCPIEQYRDMRIDYTRMSVEDHEIQYPKLKFGYTDVMTDHGLTAVYVQRTPTRNMRMSFCPRSIVSFSPDNNKHVNNNMIIKTGLRNMFKGVYNTFEQALEESRAVSLSRSWAIKRLTWNEFGLYHTKDLVGDLNKQDKRIILYPTFSYLKDDIGRYLASQNQGGYEIVCH